MIMTIPINLLLILNKTIQEVLKLQKTHNQKNMITTIMITQLRRILKIAILRVLLTIQNNLKEQDQSNKVIKKILINKLIILKSKRALRK